MDDYNIKMDDKFYAEQFAEMIKCPTVTKSGSESFEKLREVMKKNCPLVWQNCEFTQLPDDVVILKWKGKSSEKPLVLMGHQDVVPAVGGQWKYPPYSGKIDDGRVWGRGTGDDKNSVYITMRAAEELMEDGFVPEQDIYLSYSDSEEQYGTGVENAKQWYIANGIKPNMVMDEGGAMGSRNVAPKFLTKDLALVGCLEKGYVDVKFIAKSKGGHSSTPPANTPIERLSKLVHYCMGHKLFKNRMPKVGIEMLKSIATALKPPLNLLVKQTWLLKPILLAFGNKISPQLGAMFGTTMVFTMSGASSAPNVLPQEAYVVANLRLMPYDKLDDVIAKLTKIAEKFDCSVEILEAARNAAAPLDTSTEQFAYLKKCVNEMYPNTAVVPYIMTGGTDCRVMQEICPNAYRFAPCMFDLQQMSAMHAADENIYISSIVDGIRFFKYMIKNYK